MVLLKVSVEPEPWTRDIPHDTRRVWRSNRMSHQLAQKLIVNNLILFGEFFLQTHNIFL